MRSHSLRIAAALTLAASLLTIAAAPVGAVPASGSAASPAAPQVSLESPSAILVEATSGQVLLEKNSHERRAPASITKIMTLLLAFEAIADGRIKATDEVTASPEAASLGGTQIWLEAGERLKVSELLETVAVASANDAAQALAEYVGGSAEGFVDLMNRRAQELGMKDTHFANAHGLDAEGHYTSAYDLALLAREAVRHPELLRLTAIYDTTITPTGRSKPLRLTNRNRLVRFYEGADGLKTGMTDLARYSLVATARRSGSRFITVILGAETPSIRQNEAIKLLNLGFATYVSVPLVRAGEAAAEPLRVVRGTMERVPVTVASDFGVAVHKGQEKKVTTRTILPQSVDSPLKKGQQVGEIVVTVEDQEVARVPIVAALDVPRAGFFHSLWLNFSRLIRM